MPVVQAQVVGSRSAASVVSRMTSGPPYSSSLKNACAPRVLCVWLIHPRGLRLNATPIPKHPRRGPVNPPTCGARNMYLVLRDYRNEAPGGVQRAIELQGSIKQVLAGVPGLHAYYAVDKGDGSLVTVS